MHIDLEKLEDYTGWERLDELFTAALSDMIVIEGVRQTGELPYRKFLGALSVELEGGTVEIY